MYSIMKRHQILIRMSDATYREFKETYYQMRINNNVNNYEEFIALLIQYYKQQKLILCGV